MENTSKAFWLLLKNDDTFFHKTIENCNDICAIKVPNEMETDGDSLKDILFEPAIHSVICSNKDTVNFVPNLKYFYLLPTESNWISKCNKIVKKIDKSNKKQNFNIPN